MVKLGSNSFDSHTHSEKDAKMQKPQELKGLTNVFEGKQFGHEAKLEKMEEIAELLKGTEMRMQVARTEHSRQHSVVLLWFLSLVCYTEQRNLSKGSLKQFQAHL